MHQRKGVFPSVRGPPSSGRAPTGVHEEEEDDNDDDDGDDDYVDVDDDDDDGF